jgi:hypothetical protein
MPTSVMVQSNSFLGYICRVIGSEAGARLGSWSSWHCLCYFCSCRTWGQSGAADRRPCHRDSSNLGFGRSATAWSPRQFVDAVAPPLANCAAHNRRRIWTCAPFNLPGHSAGGTGMALWSLSRLRLLLTLVLVFFFDHKAFRSPAKPCFSNRATGAIRSHRS